MPLSDDVREKIVLALTGTTREQCQIRLAKGEKRCAQGVILEGVYGVVLHDWAPNHWVWSSPAGENFLHEVGNELACAISRANNSGASFDEIVKLVKEWEG